MPVPDPFRHIEPNGDTELRYKAIDDAWVACHKALVDTLKPYAHLSSEEALNPNPADYEANNSACKAFYDVIQKVCPPSADRSAAERCARLARMKANHAMTPSGTYPAGLVRLLGDAALSELLSAKLQANASIALALPHELPAWEKA